MANIPAPYVLSFTKPLSFFQGWCQTLPAQQNLFYISALCLVQAAALSCQGSLAVPQNSGLCSLLAVALLPPSPSQECSQYLEMTWLCAQQQQFLLPSHWWEQSCVSRQLSQLCHHSQRSWRETKTLNFTWPWNCASGQSVGLKPPLTLLSSQGSVVESWCSCCQWDYVLWGCWFHAEQPGWPSSVTHTSQPGLSPASQSLAR